MKKNGKTPADRKSPPRPSVNPAITGRQKHGNPYPPAGSTSANAARIFLIQFPEPLSDAVRNAAGKVFPGVQFIEAKSVAEAISLPLTGTHQLLILTDRNETEVGLAIQATDAELLPRWTVVILGRNSSELAESVSLDECHPPLLARVFRSVMLQHELLRENLQLRGDLKTVARRARHDLLSPLNCIYLSCELLKELLADEAPAVQSQIEVIHRSLAETCLLIDRISEILKASADRLPAVCVSMGTVVDNVLRGLETEIKQSGAVIRRPVKWPKVMGVEKWLEITWWNLIVNALRHGRSQAPIQLGWNEDPQFVRFWVMDRGEGVSSEIETRLFTRFDHLHIQPGRGLGLSLVQRLVSLQGGRCGYERNADGTSLFYFTSPIVPLSMAT